VPLKESVLSVPPQVVGFKEHASRDGEMKIARERGIIFPLSYELAANRNKAAGQARIIPAPSVIPLRFGVEGRPPRVFASETVGPACPFLHPSLEKVTASQAVEPILTAVRFN